MLSVQKDASWKKVPAGYELWSIRFGLLAEILQSPETLLYSGKVVPRSRYHLYDTSLQELMMKVSLFIEARDRITKYLDNHDCDERTKSERGGRSYEQRRSYDKACKITIRMPRQQGGTPY